jgi:hypothetical protein
MPKLAKETAYYLNGKIPAVALIAKGIRLPVGTWIRVADPTVLPRHMEEMLADMFPKLKGKVISFATLRSESDVEQFESSHGPH